MRAVTLAAAVVFLIASPAAAEICVEVDVRVAAPAPSIAVLRSMTSEADAIWRPYGVRFQWTGDADSVECPFIARSFDVQLSDAPRRHSVANALTLGSTWVTPPAARRSPIHLDYAATRRIIASLAAGQLDRILGRRETTASDLGRALGRVLAHEIGHGLLGARHERRGLMRATILASELIGHWRRGYTLSESEIARLRLTAHQLATDKFLAGELELDDDGAPERLACAGEP
jgi:hypothetical protein